MMEELEALQVAADRLHRRIVRARLGVTDDKVERLSVRVDELEDQIAKAVVNTERYAPEEVSAEERVAIAVRAQVPITFDYVDREGSNSTRVLSPYSLMGDLVEGWDHGRDAIRRFRVDRIERVQEAADEFVAPVEA